MAIPPDVLAVARANRRQLAALEQASRSALERQWRAALVKIEKELVTASAYRRGQLEFMRLTMSASLAATDAALVNVLSVALPGAALQGGRDAGEEVRAWLAHYGADAGRIDLAAASAISDGLVLERLAASRAAWLPLHAQAVRGVLAQSLLTKTDRLKTTLDVKAALDSKLWQARRIVRTELSTAYHAGHLRGLTEARDDVGLEVKKTTIIVRDLRTAPDSYPMDGQIRELEEMFQDGAGRRFLSPPGRPNDREKQVAWMGDPIE